MVRGVARQKIFLDVEDYLFFEKRLGEVLKKSETPCFAWAIMPNHVHLLLMSNKKSISHVMHSLLTGYASYFNRKYERSGYVFQNRYKSILCDKQEYFNKLIAYIHLNPLRASLVTSLQELAVYPWTGHSAIMGNKSCDWLIIPEILANFSLNKEVALGQYLSFLASEISETEPNLDGGGLIRSNHGIWKLFKEKNSTSIFSDERILGGSQFVQTVFEANQEKERRSNYFFQKGYNLNYLIERAVSIFEVSVECLMTKSRQKNITQAPAVICKWGIDELQLSSTEISRALSISRQAVLLAAERGRKYCQKCHLLLED